MIVNTMNLVFKLEAGQIFVLVESRDTMAAPAVINQVAGLLGHIGTIDT